MKPSPFACPHTQSRFADPEHIKKSQLSPSVRRMITRKEAYLERKCRRIWEARNPQGEQFIFASFCRNRDRLIVTLAAYVPNVGYVTQH